LGVYGFNLETKKMELAALHPGVTLAEIQSSSQFEILMPETIEETQPPTKKELEILRKIDPLGISLGK